MKWIQISKPLASVAVFHLMDENQTVEKLRYNPLQQSIRIISGDQHRVLFIRKAKSGENQFRFLNEYGFDIGKVMINDMDAKAGFIEIDEKHFNFRLIDNLRIELFNHDSENKLPVLSCAFIEVKKDALFTYTGLLLGLSWFQLLTEYSVPTVNRYALV